MRAGVRLPAPLAWPAGHASLESAAAAFPEGGAESLKLVDLERNAQWGPGRLYKAQRVSAEKKPRPA